MDLQTHRLKAALDQMEDLAVSVSSVEGMVRDAPVPSRVVSNIAMEGMVAQLFCDLHADHPISLAPWAHVSELLQLGDGFSAIKSPCPVLAGAGPAGPAPGCCWACPSCCCPVIAG